MLNLSTNKPAVLQGVRRLLRPGGEFYFSDVYADRRLPDAVRRDPVLYGECLGGALYWNDFMRLARATGFADPRLVGHRPLAITDPALLPLLGEARFHAASFRLFQIAELEDACEDHGQAVTYRGTIPHHPHHPHRFDLDAHHALETGRLFPVCGNSFRMLQQSRFAPHFEFHGSFERHFGIFPGCGASSPFSSTSDSPASEGGGGAEGTSSGAGCC